MGMQLNKLLQNESLLTKINKKWGTNLNLITSILQNNPIELEPLSSLSTLNLIKFGLYLSNSEQVINDEEKKIPDNKQKLSDQEKQTIIAIIQKITTIIHDMLMLRFFWMGKEKIDSFYQFINTVKEALPDKQEHKHALNAQKRKKEDDKNDLLLVNQSPLQFVNALNSTLEQIKTGKIAKIVRLQLQYLNKKIKSSFSLKWQALPRSSKILGIILTAFFIAVGIAAIIACPASLAVVIPLIGKITVGTLALIISGVAAAVTLSSLGIHAASIKVKTLPQHLNTVTKPDYDQSKQAQAAEETIKKAFGNNWLEIKKSVKHDQINKNSQQQKSFKPSNQNQKNNNNEIITTNNTNSNQQNTINNDNDLKTNMVNNLTGGQLAHNINESQQEQQAIQSPLKSNNQKNSDTNSDQQNRQSNNNNLINNNAATEKEQNNSQEQPLDNNINTPINLNQKNTNNNNNNSIKNIANKELPENLKISLSPTKNSNEYILYLSTSKLTSLIKNPSSNYAEITKYKNRLSKLYPEMTQLKADFSKIGSLLDNHSEITNPKTHFLQIGAFLNNTPEITKLKIRKKTLSEDTENISKNAIKLFLKMLEKNETITHVDLSEIEDKELTRKVNEQLEANKVVKHLKLADENEYNNKNITTSNQQNIKNDQQNFTIFNNNLRPNNNNNDDDDKVSEQHSVYDNT